MPNRDSNMKPLREIRENCASVIKFPELGNELNIKKNKIFFLSGWEKCPNNRPQLLCQFFQEKYIATTTNKHR